MHSWFKAVADVPPILRLVIDNVLLAAIVYTASRTCGVVPLVLAV